MAGDGARLTLRQRPRQPSAHTVTSRSPGDAVPGDETAERFPGFGASGAERMALPRHRACKK